MQYIKAKFLKNGNPTGRSYTYKTHDDVKAGDIVENVNGTKLIIIDKDVSEEWVDAYGDQNIAIVKKIKESEEK